MPPLPPTDPDDLDFSLGMGDRATTPIPTEGDPLPPPVVGSRFTHVSVLPRGCVASDSNGRAVVVHPDGRYHRVGGPQIPATIDSTTFGPYRVEVVDLTEAECAAWTQASFLEPEKRQTVFGPDPVDVEPHKG